MPFDAWASDAAAIRMPADARAAIFIVFSDTFGVLGSNQVSERDPQHHSHSLSPITGLKCTSLVPPATVDLISDRAGFRRSGRTFSGTRPCPLRRSVQLPHGPAAVSKRCSIAHYSTTKQNRPAYTFLYRREIDRGPAGNLTAVVCRRIAVQFRD